jgi:hypothetical protein
MSCEVIGNEAQRAALDALIEGPDLGQALSGLGRQDASSITGRRSRH